MSFMMKLLVLLAVIYAVQGAGPLNQTYFQPTNRTTSILLPNPPNPSCEVLMELSLTGSTESSTPQPSAEPVASSVQGKLNFQVSNLRYDSVESFTLLVDVPPNVIFETITGGSIGTPHSSTTNSSLITYPLASSQKLAGSGTDSAFLNTTVIAGTQDLLPRTIFLEPQNSQPGQCALALAGSPPNPRLPVFAPSSSG